MDTNIITITTITTITESIHNHIDKMHQIEIKLKKTWEDDFLFHNLVGTGYRRRRYNTTITFSNIKFDPG
jgi:hypothetical protein